ncbi:uncharacterized protein B0H18DRAFT_1165744 [Fomitopsis serialis]|uniref:uncharacterized protein n=1 Tax=Fomitopsis serialis TaxID=139415 RepID=UPI0020076FE7|nr:uncharacterized protein B0H18DRAFT_1165744 [Neoantrodia serialis]KAH9926768.1 hypothetical protein B0H18DRAFT_1165744 [Neoantrodia serialis]
MRSGSYDLNTVLGRVLRPVLASCPRTYWLVPAPAFLVEWVPRRAISTQLVVPLLAHQSARIPAPCPLVLTRHNSTAFEVTDLETEELVFVGTREQDGDGAAQVHELEGAWLSGLQEQARGCGHRVDAPVLELAQCNGRRRQTGQRQVSRGHADGTSRPAANALRLEWGSDATAHCAASERLVPCEGESREHDGREPSDVSPARSAASGPTSIDLAFG